MQPSWATDLQQPLSVVNRSVHNNLTFGDLRFQDVEFIWKSDRVTESAKKIGSDVREERGMIEKVNRIIFEGIQSGASDIKVGPERSGLRISFGIDGSFYSQDSLLRSLGLTALDAPGLISRLKITGDLDIGDKIHMQDGGAKLLIRSNKLAEPREFKLRIATNVNNHGEGAVVRLLDPAKSPEIATLLPDHILSKYMEVLSVPNGITLCTGPTGHGKTTTLYATLRHLNDGHRNIFTVEDPVEYEFGDIWQVQVNREAKPPITFASALRSFLRQAPHVILVGEIRDHETLEIAIEAALTGHQVFSTMHTNDAATTVSRMLNMGAPPYLVADSLRGVMAQRLLPKLCDGCKERVDVDGVMLAHLDPSFGEDSGLYPVFQKGSGCEECGGRGVRGRVGLFELMPCDPEITELIQSEGTTNQIHKAAVAHGMLTLRQEALQRLLEGDVSYEDACHVAGTRPMKPRGS